MRTLYFDCFAGASGNMILGALIALGVDKEELKKNISLLDIAKFDLQISQVDRLELRLHTSKLRFRMSMLIGIWAISRRS